MVMDACPSPQSVGREFVRQYYTLLNKAPSHLHRFYNNFSSFVHGGLDAPNRETLPVIGQKQIHNRIQQLNFRDCHAKISQVDAQATLGGGVVVQVSGELSNGGAPMRRFTQTFVLAAQSPKKYYVHNDIFRYQDIVVSDEEGSGSGSGEALTDVSEEERGYFPPPPAFPPPPPAPVSSGPPPPPVASATLATLATPATPATPATEHNGHPHHNDELMQQMHSTSLGSSGAVPEPEAEPEEPEVEPEPEPEPPNEMCMSGTPLPPQPKTYANLLKQVSAQATRPQPMQQQVAPPLVTPPAAVPVVSPPRDVSSGRGGGGGGGGGTAAGSRGSSSRFPDAAQLFLGNVPPTASEHALKQLFSKFGTVAELRVHGRGGPSGAVSRGAAAYGFITYESPASARLALSNQPIMFEATKLNLEEKKRRGEAPQRMPRNNYRR